MEGILKVISEEIPGRFPETTNGKTPGGITGRAHYAVFRKKNSWRKSI